MICEYGCGQEANYQLKNGKCCCSKNICQCPTINKKRSEAMIETWNDQDLRKKQSEVIKRVWSDLETKHKIIESQKEGWNKPGVKENHSKLSKQGWNKPGVKEKFAEVMKKVQKEVQNRSNMKERHRELMLNGGSAYAISFIKNPSKEGIKFRNLVLEVYLIAILEYKILNYSIDAVIEDYKIALEYDGWYHFNCQESIDYHNKRQREIEALGWRFIRYNIFQPFPTKEQITKDIDSIIKGDNKINVTTNRKNVCSQSALRPTIEDQR